MISGVLGRGGLSAATAVALGTVLACGGAGRALAADRTAPAPRCELTGAHLQLSVRGLGTSRPRLEVSGFPESGCDGASAILVVSGNPAGDPRDAPTEALGTFDSRLDPCTQQASTAQPAVIDGVMDFAGCAAGGPAGAVSLHDATRFSVQVVGEHRATSPPSRTSSGPHSAAGLTPGDGHGVRAWWASVAAVSGVGSLAAGFARRRRSSRRASTA